MKQIFQSVRHGEVGVLDVPAPELKGPGALVATHASLLSPGTERTSLEFAKSGLLRKAGSRPDLVRQVMQKASRDGVVEALRVAFTRLDRPVAPGYAAAGIVLVDAGSDCPPGTPVACAGAGYATHAEVNFVPRNLMVPIPRTRGERFLSFEEACFATLGAIALHGARLAAPQLGDRAVVIGLGLIGLLAVQILRAHGCRVLGIDPVTARCELAKTFGADDAVPPENAGAIGARWSAGLGADLVLICAGSESSAPAVQAAELSRDRGRIVAVGATGLDLPRREYFEKELSFVVSRSYGPGRYDPEYEEKGRDYPRGYVRWTERENMHAFLAIVADGRVDVRSLITHRLPIDRGADAYALLDDAGAMGIVINYPVLITEERLKRNQLISLQPPTPRASGPASIAMIGAGNFGTGVLLPALRATPAALTTIVTATGLSARHTGEKYGFRAAATDAAAVWNDRSTDAVVIATRHDLHAALIVAALESGKAVFVEKPLCLTSEQLDEIIAARAAAIKRGRRGFVMVGFNRRFAPLSLAARRHMNPAAGPVSAVYRVNAGRVRSGMWIADAEVGGGRIIGEACHFLDLCSWFAASPIASVSAVLSTRDNDEAIIIATMANGSLATVAYLVDGNTAFSKERIELIGNGRVAVLEDFRKATLSAGGRTKRMGGLIRGADKGHRREMQAFVDAVGAGAAEPVPFADAVNVTRATIAALESIRLRHPVEI